MMLMTLRHICFKVQIQSTLVISTLLISNNRLTRSGNLVPVLTQRSTNRQHNIVEKRRNCSLGAISPLFHNIFNISLTQESNYIFNLLKVVVRLIVFLSSANLIFRSTDISKCFIESLGIRDNGSRLYNFFKCQAFSQGFRKLYVCLYQYNHTHQAVCTIFDMLFLYSLFFFFLVYSSSFLSLYFPINKVSLGVTKCPGLHYGTSAQLASVKLQYQQTQQVTGVHLETYRSA